MIQDLFTSKFFAANRRQLRQALDSDVLVIVTANGVLQRNGDNTFRFRQDSNFWYLTGVEDPDVVLVMAADGEYLIVPPRDPVVEVFDGRIDPDNLTQRSGIASVLPMEEGWQRLEKLLLKTKQLATMVPPPPYLDFYGFYTNPARLSLVKKLQAVNAKLELLDLREHMGELRVIKQAQEMAAIQQAVDVTIKGLKYITDPKRLAKYEHEYEAEADLTRMFRRAGMSHAFDPIVAGGARACQLHNTENSGRLSAGDYIVIDVGAENGLYAADVARTTIVGKPSKRQQAVYDAVCEVQDYAFSLVKPGVVNMDYEKQIEDFMGQKLKQLKLIKTVDRDSVRHYFPHMMSHFVGLEAHDIGDYRQPMHAGMVLVCEPGIYIPEEGIGVRIEDVVAVTGDGYRLLSGKLPRNLY